MISISLDVLVGAVLGFGVLAVLVLELYLVIKGRHHVGCEIQADLWPLLRDQRQGSECFRIIGWRGPSSFYGGDWPFCDCGERRVVLCEVGYRRYVYLPCCKTLLMVFDTSLLDSERVALTEALKGVVPAEASWDAGRIEHSLTRFYVNVTMKHGYGRTEYWSYQVDLLSDSPQLTRHEEHAIETFQAQVAQEVCA